VLGRRLDFLLIHIFFKSSTDGLFAIPFYFKGYYS